MKKLSTVFFLMFMPMMSVAQTRTIKVENTKSTKEESVCIDSTVIQCVPARKTLNELVGLTPGVFHERTNSTGLTISSFYSRSRRSCDNSTPPNRGSDMIDTPSRQSVSPQFAVREFSCPTSGVGKALQQLKRIAIIPNPSSSIVQLSFTSTDKNGIVIHIYNSQGAIVRTIRDDEVAEGDWSTTVNMTDCTEGTYVVQLIQGSDVRTGRFLLVR